MFRIDDPTAAPALPAPEAAGTEGYFTEGSPGVVVPTDVRASWLNMIQEELRAIVVAGGGVPSKTTYNQVLTALRAAGVFQTAAKFDTTTKAATTAFVQAALGSLAGMVTYSGNTVLTSADVGKLVYLSANGNLTLPNATTLKDGAKITVLVGSTVTGSVISTNGNFSGPNSNGGSTLTFNGSVEMEFVSSGVSWYVYGGSGLASLATNGYQKFPSGLIVQWGQVTTSGSPASATWTYPIAFPNQVFNAYATAVFGGTAQYASPSTPSLSSVVVTSSAVATCAMLAIGY